MTLIQKNMRFWLDYCNMKDEIIAEGERKGEQKGRIEGKLEGKIEDARKMLELGLEVELIHKVTGLSCDDIIALKEL